MTVFTLRMGYIERAARGIEPVSKVETLREAIVSERHVILPSSAADICIMKSAYRITIYSLARPFDSGSPASSLPRTPTRFLRRRDVSVGLRRLELDALASALHTASEPTRPSKRPSLTSVGLLRVQDTDVVLRSRSLSSTTSGSRSSRQLTLEGSSKSAMHPLEFKRRAGH